VLERCTPGIFSIDVVTSWRCAAEFPKRDVGMMNVELLA